MAKLVSSIIISYLLITSIEETLSREVPFTKCPSPFGLLNSVDVTPCNGNPCVFKPGTNETVTVTFTPNEVVSKGDIHLYAKRGLIWIELPLKNPHICHELHCPLKKGVPETLSVTQQVPRILAPGTNELKADIVDQNGGMVVCGIIKVEIEGRNPYTDFE
ncbi:Mite group 2 allergen Gly d 2.02 [Acropora cervicornis]|uniref:Mite group 2 allergen Gly d 2.02 n=1 Tax=Acropora cervicornis TaxID=6130 RepID=A0AAD9Q7A1_ACRCE|nr:Mite group 2 allergen Gly d 2.02 [Acropora cervicornis]